MRAAIAIAALVALAACSTSHVHLFGAFRYDETSDCLEAAAAVDVIDGPDPGMCPQVRCWISAAGDVYVTDTACDAPLDYKDHTADTSGACVKAIAVYGRAGHGRCPADAMDGGA